MKILVTGGTGYIGSHTAVVLLQAGHEVVLLDNLCNSSPVVADRITEIAGRPVTLIEGDITDSDTLDQLFRQHSIDSVVHFAGFKAVGESTQYPLPYFGNNVAGTITLLTAMTKANVKKIVFSSSATVYGNTAPVPYVESFGRGQTNNTYGLTKSMIEQILEALSSSDPEWSIISLRYFNPVGAHESGRLGEDPAGIPNNLMPFIAQVAVGRRKQLSIFGGDYPTPDGTCRRDYIHVMDLAEGHLAALNILKPGIDAINLGTGRPLSVLEMVRAFEDVTGVKVPSQIVSRREGDLPEFWADAEKASRVMSWKAKRSLNDMMEDTWRWQLNNPDGYKITE
ncbi:MAG: UDP-glucose 4-epimerase GalE [Pseudohongiella sp.]|nr:UDP-glucose 4-epimerase GalE [Pseudohongiella sp.]